jgi:hypothetical protein
MALSKGSCSYAEWPFLGTFAKLRKATISFAISVCLSVCLSSCQTVRIELGSHRAKFREI